jgi:hypothetical protein
VPTLTAVACALALAAPSVARADASTSPDTTAEGSRALDAAADALGPDQVEPAGGEATAALSQLAGALPLLEGRERRRAEGILARPTDGASDEFGDGYTVPPGQVKSEPSPDGHFCVWWVETTADRPDLTDANVNGLADYVEAIIHIAETSYAVEVGDLDWVSPKPDQEDDCSPNPAGPQTDIYLKEIGIAGLFGYEAPDPDAGNQGRSRYGYLVIDNDYAPDEFPGYTDPLDAARVTVAHEFNHALHDRYDAFQDLWMFEASAVWMEQRVFPDVNDYLHYLPAFAATPGTPITDPRGAGGLKIYGSSVWNHWLAGRYGPEIVRRAWEVSDLIRPRDFSIEAYDHAISDQGGPSFSREFARFAATTAEWRTGAGKFPDASEYPDMRRKGTLRPGGGRAKRFELDHLSYRLLRVKRARAKRVRLRLHAQHGVRAGVALVARKHGRVSGRMRRKVDFLPHGGNGSVGLGRLKRFERVTAVIVNADGRADGFGAVDRNYRKDKSRFRAMLIRQGRGPGSRARP